MQCQRVSLFVFALVYMVHAVPAVQYKLLSEKSGLFVKLHSNGQVTADASRGEASTFTITHTQSGKFRFASSGHYLAISDSDTITSLMTASSGNTDFTHVSASTIELTFALKLERNGDNCFIGFQANGQPISNPCSSGRDSSSVETQLQIVLS